MSSELPLIGLPSSCRRRGPTRTPCGPARSRRSGWCAAAPSEAVTVHPSSSAAVIVPSRRRSPSTPGFVLTFTWVPIARRKWSAVRSGRSSPGCSPRACTCRRSGRARRATGRGPGRPWRSRRCRRRPRRRPGPAGPRPRARGRRGRARPPRASGVTRSQHAVGGRHGFAPPRAASRADRATAWAEAHAVQEHERSMWPGSVPGLDHRTDPSVKGRSVAAGDRGDDVGLVLGRRERAVGALEAAHGDGVAGPGAARRRRPGRAHGIRAKPTLAASTASSIEPTSAVRSSRRRTARRQHRRLHVLEQARHRGRRLGQRAPWSPRPCHGAPRRPGPRPGPAGRPATRTGTPFELPVDRPGGRSWWRPGRRGGPGPPLPAARPRAGRRPRRRRPRRGPAARPPGSGPAEAAPRDRRRRRGP